MKYFFSVILSIAIFLLLVFAFIYVDAFRNDIWISRLEGSNDVITVKINHKMVCATGGSYTFKVWMGKDRLFKHFKTLYNVFDEEENYIVCEEKNELILLEKLYGNTYVLSSPFIIVNSIRVPFPDYLMSYENHVFGDSATIRLYCEFDYLKDFYSHYKNMKITESQIRFVGRNLSMRYDDGFVTVEKNSAPY